MNPNTHTYKDSTWERLLDWLYDVDEMTIDEMRKELDEMGLDTKPVLKRIREALRAKAEVDATAGEKPK